MTTPDYPPLTSLEDLVLHPVSQNLYACQAPVSDDIQTFYDWRCPKCVDRAEDNMRKGYSVVQSWQREGTSEVEVVSLAWLVDRSRYYGIGSYLRARSVG